MSLNHGINTRKSDTAISAVVTALVGIPFFIGAWPCHTAGGYTGKPQIAYNFSEAKKLGGFSKAWRDSSFAPKWSLCQAMYSQFGLFGVGPAIFMNLFDPATHKTAVAEASFTVTDHVAALPFDAIDDSGLVVNDTATPANTLVKGTDYDVIYGEDACYVELISTSSHYSDASLKIAYNAANPGAITATDVSAAVEKVEECKSLFGIVPDLLCAPGWSATSSVALVMAAKAASINGVYKAKAVVDLDTSSGGADEYSDVLNTKNTNGYTDENMIVCWPLAVVGTDVFDMSVIVCGEISKVDSENGDCPYESPSNKTIPVTGTRVKSGTEINLTLPQADVVSYNDGVVTAINNGGWVLWGNYTGCWPTSTDVAKHFICTNRMQDFICNTFVNTFWGYLDRPLTRVMIDAIVNTFNSWLSGLTHENKLYGGEIQFVGENNPTSSLIAGKFRLDAKEASPVPAQEIDMVVEYDIDFLTAALSE